jgi:hypothetical protein
MKLIKLASTLLISLALIAPATAITPLDTPYQRCLNAATAQRKADLAAGMDRNKADKKWAAAVNACIKKFV